MRTNTNAFVTTRTVFGFNQDVVAVATRVVASCAYAAQHLHSWHASLRASDSSRVLKRRDVVGKAGAPESVKHLRLAITGPDRLAVRPMSPAVVMA